MYFADSQMPSAGSGRSDITAKALSASNGAVQWSSSNPNPAGLRDTPNAIAVSPDGTSVYVVGRRLPGSYYGDYVTVAFRAADGAQRWVGTRGGVGEDAAQAVSVSSDSSRVYVTGYVAEAGGAGALDLDYGTVAYDAATGRESCSSRYQGPNSAVYGDYDAGYAVLPAGDRVYVTGYSDGLLGSRDTATIGYSRPQAVADAYAVLLSIDGVPQPLHLGPLADSRASSNADASASVTTVTLPAGLGDVVVGQTQASARTEFACATSKSSVTILSARLLAGLIEVEGLDVAVDGSLSEHTRVQAESFPSTRRIARLSVAGRTLETVDSPITVELPGGRGTVSLFETIAREERTVFGAALAESEVRGLRIQARLDTGQRVDLILGAAYVGTSDGGFSLTPRPAE